MEIDRLVANREVLLQTGQKLIDDIDVLKTDISQKQVTVSKLTEELLIVTGRIQAYNEIINGLNEEITSPQTTIEIVDFSKQIENEGDK